MASTKSGKTIAVAGGTGFIGVHVIARLCAAGHRVVVLARGRRPMPALEQAELRRCDLARGVAPELLAGCEIVVNLVGIKRATSALGWEQAHVEIPRALADAAELAGVAELIHVSVADCDRLVDRLGGRAGPYLETKARGEQVLRERSGALALTIVRPGVVFGPGDDMLRNLADSIRAAPVFPAPAGGRATIQPVAVEDVAEAVLRCVERPGEGVRAFDVVGPERLELREVVGRVAAVLERRCVVAPAPVGLMRAAAAVLERGSGDPLITRSQLGLLTHGLVGDPEPARVELGLEPRPLDDAAIERALASFEPRLPSVRLVPDRRAARELTELGGADTPTWRLAGFAALAVAGLLIGPWLPGSIWLRMAGLELLLSLLAIATLRLDWTKLWRPSPAKLGWGLGAGLVMWAGALAVAAALSTFAPQLWSGSTSLYAWTDELAAASAVVLLTVIVAGEEIVWRGALGIGLAAKIGPWPAVLASAGLFTIAHLTTGPPVLAIAAALAGAAWTWLAIRTRSLAASFVAHLGWDAAMLWLTPLA